MRHQLFHKAYAQYSYGSTLLCYVSFNSGGYNTSTKAVPTVEVQLGDRQHVLFAFLKIK